MPGRRARARERQLRKIPKVEGSGAGQLYLAPETARVFDTAAKLAAKAGDSFITAERLLQALAIEQSEAARILKEARVTPQALNAAIDALRKGRTADTASAEQGYDALKKYARDLTEVAALAASSTRSSAGMRKSAAPCRCCRGAPRTTRC